MTHLQQQLGGSIVVRAAPVDCQVQQVGDVCFRDQVLQLGWVLLLLALRQHTHTQTNGAHAHNAHGVTWRMHS
jgi:hypothetical protein